MITAIDTSVLLDVFGADATFGPLVKQAIGSCQAEGQLVVCEVVWAKVASFFPSSDAAQDFMIRLGVEFSPVGLGTAILASMVWKEAF